MTESFKSLRNCVELHREQGNAFVIKTFREAASFQKERQVYGLLQGKLPCARVLWAEGNALALSQLPGKNLVECLEEQERTGLPQWDMWEKLVVWLTEFQKLTGYIMTDVNLRNFLYDEKTQTLYGVDFEECRAGSMAACAGGVAAFVRLYRPENTPLKQEISQFMLRLFARYLEMEVDVLFLESARREAMLLQRRNRK